MLLAAASALAACHKAPEQQPSENQASEAPKPVAPPPKPAPKPVPAPVPKADPVKVQAAPEPTADQQMLDDADATGMTSHASRESDASNASGNSQQ
jgi:hypothetical protein